MIQRIQSIYLLIATNAYSLVFLFAPLGILVADNATQPIFPYCTFVTILMMFFGVLIPLLNFVAIFFYKKRKMQIHICTAAIISFVFLALFYIYFCLSVNTTINYFIILSPVVSLVFTVLAIKSIKKDENLVRAADRIR